MKEGNLVFDINGEFITEITREWLDVYKRQQLHNIIGPLKSQECKKNQG